MQIEDSGEKIFVSLSSLHRLSWRSSAGWQGPAEQEGPRQGNGEKNTQRSLGAPGILAEGMKVSTTHL